MRRLLSSCAVVLATLFAALPAEGATVTEAVGDGGWSYFGDPRAIYLSGRTFVGWTTPTGQVQVGSFRGRRTEDIATVDSDAGAGDTPDAITTLDQFGVDDHSNPSLTTLPDGRIVVLYADHANDRARFGELYYRISRRPHDVSDWGPVRSVPGVDRIPGGQGVAYPNPVQTASGKTLVFWRGNNWWPNVSVTDDFKRWSRPRTLIRGPRKQRPYAKYAGTGGGAFVAYTNAHPNSRPTSIWCLFVREDGTLLRLDGRKVGSVDRPPSYTRGTPVYRYRPALGHSWIMDVAVDAGRPVVLYFRRQLNGGNMYRLARWNGRRWIDRPIVAAGDTRADNWYVAGATLDHETPNVVYLARRRSPSQASEIEQWVTRDEGRTWTSTALTSGSTRDNWRPVSPRGLTGERTQVWWFTGQYRNYRNFQTDVKLAAGVALESGGPSR